jgi:FMN phosphatase YigB (HAD superfamily)
MVALDRWAFVFFDFDDTLYLKDAYELSPNVMNVLEMIHSAGLPLGILTYNKRVHSLLEKLGLTHMFDSVLIVDRRTTPKSTVLQTSPPFRAITDKKTILFFDNDPLNVYDVSRTGVTSFLVNPVHGISLRFIEHLLTMKLQQMYNEYEREARGLCTYVERSVYVQNMSELYRLFLLT